MSTIKHISLFVITIFWFTVVSCKKDETKPVGEFSTGVFIVNEGNFGDADGTLSFFNTSTSVVTQDIFALKNSGTPLGDVVQSVTVSGSSAYIVVNNDNKMEIVDANTMISQHTVEGLFLPRYFTTFSGKGYLTEWINFTDSGKVAIMNLDTRIIETSIATGFGTEEIIAANGKLFVSNSFESTISVIDPVAKKRINQIDVGSSPGGFVIDKNNKLWVVCGGSYDINYLPENNGGLYQINTTTDAVEKSIPLAMNVSAKLAINKTDDKIYFFTSRNIYRVDISDTDAPSSAFISDAAAISYYGIGVDPSTDILYVGDSKAFIGSGTVYRFSNDGTAIDHFTAGRGPNGFVFR